MLPVVDECVATTAPHAAAASPPPPTQPSLPLGTTLGTALMDGSVVVASESPLGLPLGTPPGSRVHVRCVWARL